MPVRTETVHVSGIRCERCVNRLAAALRGQEGLEAANANLMGQVTLSWDEERTTLDALVAALASSGFLPLQPIAAVSELQHARPVDADARTGQARAS